MKIKQILFGKVFILLILTSCTVQIDSSDPLPSWKEGKTKSAIIDFVEEIKDQDSPNFIPVKDRVLSRIPAQGPE